MNNSAAATWSLLNARGKRKYITREERSQFLTAASQFRDDVFDFCLIMSATGCRISEALSLTPGNFDFGEGFVVIESLKKRRKGIYRELPLPPDLSVRILRRIEEQNAKPSEALWRWTRMTGYRHIRSVMEIAGISGEQACPKGLRHGFAVIAIQSGIPLNLVQKWLGHADMKTTAIYAAAVGEEEKEIAARMWDVANPTRSRARASRWQGSPPMP